MIEADRGMMSRETVQRLQAMGIGYILGVKMAKDKVVKQAVLSCTGKYKEVRDNLKVKEVQAEGNRDIVCLSPDKAERDALQADIEIGDKRYAVRSQIHGLSGKIFKELATASPQTIIQ